MECTAVKLREAATGVESQGDGAELQRTCFFPPVELTISVKIVTEHRVAQSGEMGADLVGAAGEQMNSKAGNMPAFKGLVSGFDRFGTFFRTVCDPDESPAGVFDQPGATDRGRGFHDSAYEANIVLFNAPFPKYILKDLKRPFVFREQAEAAGAVVQTMARRRRKGFRIPVLDPGSAKVS